MLIFMSKTEVWTKWKYPTT